MAPRIALGHRGVGHIRGHRAHGAQEWRHAGYRQALQHTGIDYDPDLVVEGEFVFESGVHGANRLLDLPDPPTAIFAANDDTAAGRSEEHTSELQSLMRISYAVFCLKKKNNRHTPTTTHQQ